MNANEISLINVPYPPELTVEEILSRRSEEKLRLRAPNQFFIYRLAYIKELRKIIGENISMTKISPQISSSWAREPPEIKQAYKNLSDLAENRLKEIRQNNSLVIIYDNNSSQPPPPPSTNNDIKDKEGENTENVEKVNTSSSERELMEINLNDEKVSEEFTVNKYRKGLIDDRQVSFYLYNAAVFAKYISKVLYIKEYTTPKLVEKIIKDMRKESQASKSTSLEQRVSDNSSLIVDNTNLEKHVSETNRQKKRSPEEIKKFNELNTKYQNIYRDLIA
ncbi:hypothetical protein RhiirC2_850792 [Rhizophagus irregularis]|uniref:MATA-HMG n=1 Tax=Rhizophagus irregularis TaxID=588596 RepID=A0A2N1N609_9GLOM|nr:hypothetical protein RhiirC2_850792 [Rhizophagus irregularis]